MPEQVSIIVPSRSRPQQLTSLLGALARQRLARDTRLEVIVALDGGEPLQPEVPPGLDVRILTLPRVGISAAKNRAVAEARGDLLVFLNDDVEPAPDCVAAHVEAQRRGNHETLVLGHAAWAVPASPAVMDRVIAGSRMIFFYRDLQEPGARPGFRHAWNLNLSVPRQVFEKAGGFAEELRPCMYEDLESAWRLERQGHPVTYWPEARVVHHHRYTWSGYLRREILLGAMAPVLWEVNQACFLDVFGQSLPRMRETASRALDLDVPDARRAYTALAELLSRPAAEPLPDAEVQALYLAHLPLKRRAFRHGLLQESKLPADDWQRRAEIAERADLPACLFP